MTDRISLEWVFPPQGRWDEMDPFDLPPGEWRAFYRVSQPPWWKFRERFQFWLTNHVLRERIKFYGLW